MVTLSSSLSSLFLSKRIHPSTSISSLRSPAPSSSRLRRSFSALILVRTRSANWRMRSCELWRNAESGSDGAITRDDSSSVIKPLCWGSKINSSSKWVVFSILSAVVLAKHDGEASWAVMGFVVNCIVSMILKQLLNHDRPESALRADLGMPSSHSQALLYVAAYFVELVIQELGVGTISITLAALLLLIASYLSWLRVLQGLHTSSQVFVGAGVGLAYAACWFWSWHAFVGGAFIKHLWVRMPVIVGSVLFYAGFLVYVFKHWVAREPHPYA